MIRAGRLVLFLALAGPAGAVDLVDGSYGDKEGCRHAETGESSGADIFLLLDRKGVTKVAAERHEEGSEEVTPHELTLTPDKGGYAVSVPDGARWGPLMRCKT